MDSRKSYLTSISLQQTHLHSLNEMCMLCTYTTERKEKQRKMAYRGLYKQDSSCHKL